MKKILVITWMMLIGCSLFPQNNSNLNGWNFGGSYSDFKPGLDIQISQHGKNSATLESVSENPANFCTVMQNMVVRDFAGKRIKMTGYIKPKGTDEIGTMWVRIDNLGKKEFGDFDNMMDRPVTGNSDWQKCEIIFDVPDTCVIFFGFIFQGVGKVWVDNVSFETVDKSVNKTAAPIGQPFPDEYLQQLKNFPNGFPEKPALNLDFEETNPSLPKGV